jgi:4-amino-4-deoxy-L-arabinose transferase-like glycosyltransferase
MAEAPPATWIALEAPPGSYIHGLFREHPIGIHLLPAWLGRLGFPPLQAAYAANALYQAVSLVLVARLASGLVGGLEARALPVLLQLIPIAFTFRIRANHEQAVLMCVLLALLGLERSRRRAAYALLVAAGLVGILLVKGVFVVVGFAACVLWLIARRGAEGSTRVAALGLVLAAAAVLGAVWCYEQLYRSATGEGFWAWNLGRQLGVASVARSTDLVGEKLRNVVFYLARLSWFAFPWSLVLLSAAWPRTRTGQAARRCEGGGRDGLVFVLGLTAALVAGFSLSDRVADRYLFVAYYAVAAAGAVLGLRAFPRLAAVALRLDAWHPFPAVALWILTFALHLAGGRLGVPTIKVWAPS